MDTAIDIPLVQEDFMKRRIGSWLRNLADFIDPDWCSSCGMYHDDSPITINAMRAGNELRSLVLKAHQDKEPVITWNLP